MIGDRQLAQLRQVMHDYPHLTQLTEEFRAMRGKELNWPDWCFLPMGAAYGIISDQYHVEPIPPDLVADVSRIAALNAWRWTRGIYRFQPALATALARSPIAGDLPTEVFLRLPEWGIYVELPEPVAGIGGAVLYGFYAHLEHDLNDGRPELRFLLDEDDGLWGLPIHIGPWSLLEAVDQSMQETFRHARQYKLGPFGFPVGPAIIDLTDRVSGIVSLLLYLCSDNPEIASPTRPDARPSRPRPTKTKKGWRLFQPHQVTEWEVGTGLGEQLQQDGVDTGYWAGHQDGDRYRYRWTSLSGGL